MDGLLFLGALAAIAAVSIWTVVQDSRSNGDDTALPGVHNAGAKAKSRGPREIHGRRRSNKELRS